MGRIETLRAWLATHPSDRFAAYSLALELFAAGQHDEALAAIRALLVAHPHSGAGHFQHGRMELECGRPDAARRAWEAGLTALRGVTDPEAQRSVREMEGALSDLED